MAAERGKRSRRALTPGEFNAEWIETYCRIPEGKHVGKKVVLTAKQKYWLCRIYDTPTRLFILSMGRKGAKTTFAAFLLLLHLCGPESVPNGHLFSDAQSLGQAALLFGLAARIVRMSPDLLAILVIRDTAKEIACPERGTLYKALSAEAATAFGMSPSFVVHDELGQVRGPHSELYEAMETAAAAQEKPLSVIISTQAKTDGDLLSMLIDDALTGAEPGNKVEIYTAPLELDPYSDVAIRAANPHFDDFMNQDEVRRQANDAKRLPAREASYRNLILNQRVEAKEPFISRSVWIENGAQPLGDLKTAAEVYGGLDLSSVSDLTALVLVHKHGEAWDVRPTFWLPGDGLAEKSRHDRVPYDIWAKAGYLQTTPGASVEYEYVADYLRGVFDNCQVKALAFDRWNWKQLKPWLEKAGFSPTELERFVEFGQGWASMSPALREFESLLLGRKLRHGNHPVLTMCANNATIDIDKAENRKFIKGKATGRIDGMVALAMAIGVMPTRAEEKDYRIFVV